jgi:carbamoyl-phosphate synthase large subunit
MPRRNDITKILVIGSGPIVIGQSAEFDYSGTQACKALRDEGYEVVLINSNPATIMTDPELADRTYIEPLTREYVEEIIRLECEMMAGIDGKRKGKFALLPTVGGQTALNIAVDLADAGILDKYDVELIGAKLEAIKKAEDRLLFKDAMNKIGLDMPRSSLVNNLRDGMDFSAKIGFPVVIRPSFTLGGSGGGIAYNREELMEILSRGIDLSPVHECLIEESVLGWKEYELEVMRDLADNVIIICSIENMDPMGVHTGDSITVAPAQTLTDREYQAMRDAAIRVMREIGVETGGSNVQFAVNPQNGRMTVIEMNPRVSRSSALASKATGFPIAKIAAKLAVGYTLDEIPNDITRKTPACFEPTIDYVVVKVPKWQFEKFPGADENLSPQMKSVGEVMAIGRTFKEALMKAMRSLETGKRVGTEVIEPRRLTQMLVTPQPGRFEYIRYAFRKGMSVREVARLTTMDPWFLYHIKEITDTITSLGDYSETTMSPAVLRKAKRMGISDARIADSLHLDPSTGSSQVKALREHHGIRPVFKLVDTCAAEFESETPYLYSSYDEEDEAPPTAKRKVIILGSGPNRIGQGIEFDYCCCHAAFALREDDYETVMVNCNPETVSTDYDTSDRLYFEPLTLEDVLAVYEHESSSGAEIGMIVQFGGQTPLNLALALKKAGVPIIGTSPESIDLAEDRKRFGKLLESLAIPQPPGAMATSVDEALAGAETVGYPVLVRPSYVLGGRAMVIAYDAASVREYMKQAVEYSQDRPVLIDHFLEDAVEVDVDALCDGEDVVIAGIMQHIEEAGIHSGDSSCVLPSVDLSPAVLATIRDYTRKLALALDVRGLVNLQFAVQRGSQTRPEKVFVIEVNPRASRTVREDRCAPHDRPHAQAAASRAGREPQGTGHGQTVLRQIARLPLEQIPRRRYSARPGDEIHRRSDGRRRHLRRSLRQSAARRRTTPAHQRHHLLQHQRSRQGRAPGARETVRQHGVQARSHARYRRRPRKIWLHRRARLQGEGRPSQRRGLHQG